MALESVNDRPLPRFTLKRWSTFSPRYSRREVHVEQPQLPIGIESVRVSDLRVGDAMIDLDFGRVQRQVIVSPSRDTGTGVQIYVRL